MKTSNLIAAALIAAAAVLSGLTTGVAAPDNNRGWHGNWFPNVVLTTQDGKKVRFYDDVIKGKVVSLNFIYTNCGDVCPLDTAQLRQVHALLGDRVGKDVFFYSISIDPEYDTPARLKRYMRQFDIGPGWTFLTGKKKDIELIQRKLGIRVVDPKNIKDHDTRLMVGNEALGQWIKRSPFDDPMILANLLGDTLHNYSGGKFAAHRQSYSAAIEVKGPSRGEYLFRTRCDSCHTIGGGDRLGPDLAGTASARPRAWLHRWLKEPDKMLAERDPVAVAMKARYRNLPMPNLGLNDIDADALIEFLHAEDAKRAAAAKHGPAVHGGK